MIKIYTDGATSKNGDPNAVGGFAWVALSNDILLEEYSQQVKAATNNICELRAVIDACEKISQQYNEKVTIYSDSAYIINCYNQRWYVNWENNGWVNSKKQPVANKELWQGLIPFFQNSNFTFIKVKGHMGDQSAHSRWNEYVDKMAVKAKELQDEKDLYC